MDLDKLVIKSKNNNLKQIHVKTNVNYRDIKIIYKSIKLKSALWYTSHTPRQHMINYNVMGLWEEIVTGKIR